MKLTPGDEAVLAAVAAAGEAMIARAVAWCGVNSGSRNLEGLERQRVRLAQAFAILPGQVESLALPPSREVAADGAERALPHADALRVVVRPQAPVQLVLTGHYDTVYGAESPFQHMAVRPDGALHGPGIADMKGGVSLMLAALAAFEAHPEAGQVGYVVLLSPDEEIGSPASAPLLAQIAARAHVGMTYEPAMPDGALAAARKGSGNFHVAVRGAAAHAGRDFARGRNALAAAARLAAALDALNGVRDEVTVNIGRIDGGGPLNMVPDAAVTRFNIRVPDADAAVWCQARIAEILAAVQGDGLTAVLHGGFTRPPKPFNAAQQQLFGAVVEVGGLLGQAVTWRPSGGVCEGNNLFAAGLPNVDTLGVRGGDIHSEAEYAWPDSFVERAQLSALMLCKMASGEIDAPAIRAANVR